MKTRLVSYGVDHEMQIAATFQLVYVFVILEVDTRRILHFNLTRYPTAE